MGYASRVAHLRTGLKLIYLFQTDERGNGSFEALDQPSQLRKYLGTLLHEMVHAVFQLFCCRTCEPCRTRRKDEVGTSGHSMMWQKLAISIEDTLNNCSHFAGGVAFDLNRSYSFIKEFEGDHDHKANRTLQKSLTMRQLRGLKLDSWATRKVKKFLRVRDTQRAANRRKDAAARRRKLKTKTEVLGGRVSKSNTPRSRH